MPQGCAQNDENVEQRQAERGEGASQTSTMAIRFPVAVPLTFAARLQNHDFIVGRRMHEAVRRLCGAVRDPRVACVFVEGARDVGKTCCCAHAFSETKSHVTRWDDGDAALRKVVGVDDFFRTTCSVSEGNKERASQEDDTTHVVLVDNLHVVLRHDKSCFPSLLRSLDALFRWRHVVRDRVTAVITWDPAQTDKRTRDRLHALVNSFSVRISSSGVGEIRELSELSSSTSSTQTGDDDRNRKRQAHVVVHLEHPTAEETYAFLHEKSVAPSSTATPRSDAQPALSRGVLHAVKYREKASRREAVADAETKTDDGDNSTGDEEDDGDSSLEKKCRAPLSSSCPSDDPLPVAHLFRTAPFRWGRRNGNEDVPDMMRIDAAFAAATLFSARHHFDGAQNIDVSHAVVNSIAKAAALRRRP